jgi:hypothetical protein
MIRGEEASTMRLDFASVLLALLLIFPPVPLRAQDEEEGVAEGGAALEAGAAETAADETAACAAQVGKKTGAVVSQCAGWEESTPCAVYNPIRSNECEARKNAGDLEVLYDLFGKTDCRTNSGSRKLSDIDRVVIHNGGWNARHNLDTFACRQGSSHYSIQRDGAIYQHVGEELVAWHAGGSSATDETINERSIGIELNLPQEAGVSCNSLSMKGLNDAQKEALVRKACTPSDEQYTSVKSLLDAIGARTSATLDEEHVIGHCEGQNASSGSAHGDPRAFDWSRIGLSNEKKQELGGKACQWYID